MTLVDYFLPSAGQIINLFAVLAILAVFAVLGGAVSGQGRFSAADIFVGWGVVTGVFVVGGVLGPVPFTWMAFAVWGAAVPCVFLLWRRNHPDFAALAAIDVLWRVGLLALPLILLTANIKPSQWDEFSQWLPNTLFILRHDGFPGPGLPVNTSVYPVYPYALPLIT